MWLVAVLVSFVVIALLLGDALTSDGDVTSNPESKQAEALIHESFPPEPTPSEIVVVRSDRYTVDDWYLPSWLGWLPDVHVEGHAVEPSVPATPKPPESPAPATG